MAWQRSAQVVYEVVDGEGLLIDPAGVELITLNSVGALVWQTLDGCLDAAGLADALLPSFEGVTRGELERDIEAFLGELHEAGLVSEATPDGDTGR
jgi:hypothetical protein